MVIRSIVLRKLCQANIFNLINLRPKSMGKKKGTVMVPEMIGNYRGSLFLTQLEA